MPEIMLSETLLMIEDNDELCEVRDPLILRAMFLALECGFEVNFATRAKDWIMVMIELPTGQISWSMKVNQKEWDGYRDSHVMRIVRFATSVAASL
jgi:hypothetical protein